MPRILLRLDTESRQDLKGLDIAELGGRWAAEFGVELVGDPADVAASCAPDLERPIDGMVIGCRDVERGFAEAHTVGVPTVVVVAGEAGSPAGAAYDSPLGRRPRADLIAGRGIDGFRWAFRHLAADESRPRITVNYGDHADQVGDLRLPDGPGRQPVVVLVHGGGWRSHWARDLMSPAAAELTQVGFATWNIGYRRGGVSGGGWPETFEDVAAAIDHLAVLAESHALDTDRVLLLGHSAGGHLSLWSAARPRLPAGSPGGTAIIRPIGVIALAAVCDLFEAERRNISRGAVVEFLGGTSTDLPERYRLSSPAEFLPFGVPQLLVHGTEDETVPLELSYDYATRARSAGDPVEVVAVPHVDHMRIVEPVSAAWPAITAGLKDMQSCR